LVPVTPHLAEDIWLSLPENQRMLVNGQAPVSATLLPWPQVNESYMNAQLVQDFEALLAIKETVNQALEVPRSEGHIGSSLEANIALLPQDDAVKTLLGKLNPAELSVLFITSGATVVDAEPTVDAAKWHTNVAGNGVRVFTAPSANAKCMRCWKYEPTVGQMPEHSEICERCYQAVKQV